METKGNGNGGTVRTRHVGVFAFPFASHPTHLLNVVRRLAAAAPTVVFSFFSTERTNRALFTKRGCDNILRYDVSDGIPEGYVLQGKIHEDINYFLGVAKEEFRSGVQVAEKDVGMKMSCLVSDAFLWFSADLAKELSIPWVALRTGGARSLSTHLYTDLIREKYSELKGSIGPNDEIANLIPGVESIRLSDLPIGVIFGDLDSPFASMMHKMGRNLTRATTVAINSFQELDPDVTKNLSSLFNNFLNIGPSNLVSKHNSPSKPDEFSCISWLDNQNPGSVAYISFGTKFCPPPHELVAIAEALESTKTPFLWSINKDSQTHLPLGFVERTTANGSGKVVPWAPQVQVLDHIATGVFVTHGGWNSVLESIGSGVPMICRPLIGDQPINTWMVERVWGIGVWIEGGKFTKHGTCCALEQVLSVDASSKGMKERIGALKDLAHKAVGPNGSSTQNFKTLVDVITR
ncbi:hypothetical protein M8C21_019164 [Ambrosia artemisiifolia]|uniref:Glycosyltransferase n=1 Tax=Ambrosia artemisiifolia TaxID=4212 RepID=A0AAD5C3E4_AMBAR|nr:hypothetical protein M8C21_019164 [Ambrosia artemisiifolia]